eukprot:6355613-Amphidinium_carterae.2
MPLTMHPGAQSTSQIPEVGQEIAILGPEAGELLRKRRVAERCRIFAQRGTRGPDDSPFGDHHFEPSLDYRRVEWGLPVPQEEWERRNAESTLNLTWRLIYVMKAMVLDQNAMLAGGEAAGNSKSHSPSVCAVTTGH